MKSKKTKIKSAPSQEDFDKLLARLSHKELKSIANNRIKALEYAKKGIEETQPEKLDLDYIVLVADEMQSFARKIVSN